jgi:hypothetical protein
MELRWRFRCAAALPRQSDCRRALRDGLVSKSLAVHRQSQRRNSWRRVRRPDIYSRWNKRELIVGWSRPNIGPRFDVAAATAAEVEKQIAAMVANVSNIWALLLGSSAPCADIHTMPWAETERCSLGNRSNWPRGFNQVARASSRNLHERKWAEKQGILRDCPQPTHSTRSEGQKGRFPPSAGAGTKPPSASNRPPGGSGYGS